MDRDSQGEAGARVYRYKHLKNASIEPDATVNPLNVILMDTEPKAYGEALKTISLEGKRRLTNLFLGEETQGRMRFSVPAGLVLNQVIYKIGALGPPVQVNLRG